MRPAASVILMRPVGVWGFCPRRKLPPMLHLETRGRAMRRSAPFPRIRSRARPTGVIPRARAKSRPSISNDTNQARRQLLEENQDVAALQLAADDHLAVSVNAMDLKNRLRDIETDCRDGL